MRRHEPLEAARPQITGYADSVFGAGDSRVRSAGRSGGAKALIEINCSSPEGSAVVVSVHLYPSVAAIV
jgi:hypothetical protein